MKKVTCPFCGNKVMWLSEHLYEYHKIERANEWVKLLQTRENEIYDMERDEQ